MTRNTIFGFQIHPAGNKWHFHTEKFRHDLSYLYLFEKQENNLLDYFVLSQRVAQPTYELQKGHPEQKKTCSCYKC